MPRLPVPAIDGGGIPVRVRILASMLAVTIAGMALAGATAYLVQQQRTLAAVDVALSAVVESALFVAADSAGADLDSVLGDVVQRLQPKANESSLAIIDGAAALTPGGAVDFRIEDTPAFVERLVTETAGGDVVQGTAVLGERSVRYIAVPVTVRNDARAGVFVSAIDLDAELEPLNGAFLTFAFVAIGAVIAIGVVGWVVAGRLLSPLRALRDAAERITVTDLSERIPVVGHDDVSELTRTVNDMLDRVDGALTGQRRLLDDVGHELKTPITIVRGHLEVMRVDDPVDVANTRDLVVDELDRMARLVRDIVTLADADRPRALSRQLVPIAEFTERLRDKASALSSHEWVVREKADVFASIDSGRLTQAMLQLAANAASHGGAGAVIEIGSSIATPPDAPHLLRIFVTDHGDGIPLDAQARIFERFRRGVGGRGVDGSGLGLAIVAAIAAAHGGRVEVSSRPGSGATFTLELPLVTAESAGTTGHPL